MTFNPLAVIFWGICSIAGYFIGGTPEGALVGLGISLSISFVVSMLEILYDK